MGREGEVVRIKMKLKMMNDDALKNLRHQFITCLTPQAETGIPTEHRFGRG